MTITTIRLDQFDLRRAITLTTAHAARTIERPTLTGVNIRNTQDQSAVFCAADGTRLSIYNAASASAGDAKYSAILNTKDLKEIITKIKPNRALAMIVLDESRPVAAVRWNGQQVDIPLVDGNYPGYHSIIDDAKLSPITHEVSFEIGKLINVLKALTPVGKFSRIILQPNADGAESRAVFFVRDSRAQEQGSNDMSTAIGVNAQVFRTDKSPDGEAYYAFDPSLLLQTLKAIYATEQRTEIKITFRGPSNPYVITWNDDQSQTVLMPIFDQPYALANLLNEIKTGKRAVSSAERKRGK